MDIRFFKGLNNDERLEIMIEEENFKVVSYYSNKFLYMFRRPLSLMITDNEIPIYQIMFNEEIKKRLKSQFLRTIFAEKLSEIFAANVCSEAKVLVLKKYYKRLKEEGVIDKLSLREKIMEFFLVR